MNITTDFERIVLPTGAKQTEPQTLYAVLTQVSDGRKERRKRYEVALVLTLLRLAKMGGESKVSEIVEWARLRIE